MNFCQILICIESDCVIESKYKKKNENSNSNQTTNIRQLDINLNNFSIEKLEASKLIQKTDNFLARNHENNLLNKLFGPKKFQIKNNTQNKFTKEKISVLYPSVENMIYSNNMRVSSKTPKDNFKQTNPEPPPRPPPPQPLKINEALSRLSCSHKYPPTPLPCRSTLFSRIQLNSRT